MDCSGWQRVINSCAKVVLLLVLLVSFLDLPKIEEEYQVLEYFAGVGRVAALAKFCHYRSAALDIKYGEEGFLRAKKRSPMDIDSDAGLVQLVSKYKHVFLFFKPSRCYIYIYIIYICMYIYMVLFSPSYICFFPIQSFS